MATKKLKKKATKRKAPPKSDTLAKAVEALRGELALIAARLVETEKENDKLNAIQNEFNSKLIGAVRETRSNVYLTLGKLLDDLNPRLQHHQFVCFVRYCNDRYRREFDSRPPQLYHVDRMVDSYSLQQRPMIMGWLKDFKATHGDLFVENGAAA